MTIQKIINSIFRQDFRDHKVLGRVLFGVAMLFIGLMNLFQISRYAGYAPDYLPVPQLLVIGVGSILTLAGFMIFANLHTQRSAQAIVLLFISFVLIVNLPQSNMLDLAQNFAFIGGALLVAQEAKRENETKKKETST